MVSVAKVKTGCSARVRATGLQIQARQEQYRAFNRPLGSVKTLGIARFLVLLTVSLCSAAACSALDHTACSIACLFPFLATSAKANGSPRCKRAC